MSRSDQESYACNRAGAERLDERKARIRHLNDELRRLFVGGRIMVTSGVQALATDHLARALRQVSCFADFNPDNDSHDEHDFGAVEVAGQRIFWKIDCYDKQLEYGSPDAADPAVTARVLTIMLASEY
ncbi:DUF3768 domain-containing protein [Sphingomonas sp.]|uniref:DUF3768 domain-containing protein n=1 Tax=Sphingomonas sp. TaxID=28214 RepID=UPI003B008DA1